MSPQLGQNFQSLLISNPHFLHATTHAILGIILISPHQTIAKMDFLSLPTHIKLTALLLVCEVWFALVLYRAPHIGHLAPVLWMLSQYSHFTNPFNRSSCSSLSLKKHSSQTSKFATGIVISRSCNPFLRPHVVIWRFSIRMKLASSFFSNSLLHDLHFFFTLKSCKLFPQLNARMHLNPKTGFILCIS